MPSTMQRRRKSPGCLFGARAWCGWHVASSPSHQRGPESLGSAFSACGKKPLIIDRSYECWRRHTGATKTMRGILSHPGMCQNCHMGFVDLSGPFFRIIIYIGDFTSPPSFGKVDSKKLKLPMLCPFWKVMEELCPFWFTSDITRSCVCVVQKPEVICVPLRCAQVSVAVGEAGDLL